MHRALLLPQEGVTEVLFVRHGQSEQLPDGTAKELLVDPPLSEHGRHQAQVVADAIAAEPIAAIYTSDLQRAVETGRFIAKQHGLDIASWHELREFEAFRDVPAGQSVRRWIPEALMRGMSERFVRERTFDCFPYSELSTEFRNRVASAVETVLGAHPGERVVIVCHGGVINAYIAHTFGLPADVLFNPAHASISRVLAMDDRRAIKTLNEFHHLEVADPALVNY